MSINSNFKKDKCWSCEFFCGPRKYKNGIVFGDSVETEAQGTCSNKRSSNCGKVVRENDWCGRYQKWGVLQSALAKQEQEQEQQWQVQKQMLAQREEAARQRRTSEEYKQRENKLYEERSRLEEERKKLEFERWYASLPLEERERYDAEQARLKAEHEEQKRIEAERRAEQDRLFAAERTAQHEKAEVAKKRKHKIILISVLSVVVVIAIIVGAFIISSAIENSEKQKAFVESGGEQILDYIQAQSNGDNSCEFAFEYGGISYSMEIEYREDYYDEYGSPSLFGKGVYSFYASVTSFKGGKPYTYCTGKAIFNWQGLKNLDEISLIGTVQYQSNLVHNYYHDYTKGTTCPEIFYSDVTHGNGNNLTDAQLNDSVEYAWEMCKITIIGLNQLSNQVLNSDLW